MSPIYKASCSCELFKPPVKTYAKLICGAAHLVSKRAWTKLPSKMTCAPHECLQEELLPFSSVSLT